MPVQYYNGEFTKIINETPLVKRFTIKVSDLDIYDFKPGQFLMLDLPINSKVTNRSYSISSAPKGTNEVELIIILKPDGLGTNYLFDCKVGDSVKVSKPLGKYNLPDEIQKDICLISTGTGVAPHKSFVDHIFENNIPFKNLYLIAGTRTQGELLYRTELEKLDRENHNFHYIKVLSRENKDTWTGHTGYVHEVYKNLFADKRPARFYICGWRNMILEARDNLKEMGYDKSDIKFELYD